MIVLTPTQKHAKDVIEWLMSDDWANKGVGKSFLMASIFIDKALKAPGMWIPIWDHGPHHPKKEEYMMRLVSELVKEHYPNYEFKISVVHKTFSMRLKV